MDEYVTISFVLGLGVAYLFLFPVSRMWKLSWRIGIFGTAFVGMMSGMALWLLQRWVGILPTWTLILLSISAVGFISICSIAFRFYRDPQRKVPAEEGILLSPADGCVLYVKPFSDGEIPMADKRQKSYTLDEFMKTDLLSLGGLSIGIEMNILDVHVNRSPMQGSILFLKHVPGQFLSLRKPDSPFLNERKSFVIENGLFRIGVVQIASRLVRSIISYVKEGDTLEAGQRFGMIRFGSQVDLIIPHIPGLQVTVKEGLRVRAGETIVARYSVSQD